MQIKITFDDSEVAAMVNKMNYKDYSKLKISKAGEKIQKAYKEFEKIKNNPSPGQTSIEDILSAVGGKVIK